MFKHLPPAFTTAPAIMAALAYGAVEWVALTRSRFIDILQSWRRSIGDR